MSFSSNKPSPFFNPKTQEETDELYLQFVNAHAGNYTKELMALQDEGLKNGSFVSGNATSPCGTYQCNK